MNTSTTDKLFSVATIGEVEEMLTRAMTNAAIAAAAKTKGEIRLSWESPCQQPEEKKASALP